MYMTDISQTSGTRVYRDFHFFIFSDREWDEKIGFLRVKIVEFGS